MRKDLRLVVIGVIVAFCVLAAISLLTSCATQKPFTEAERQQAEMNMLMLKVGGKIPATMLR